VYGLIAGLLLAAGMVWLLLDPILRPRADAGGEDQPIDPDDDLSPRAVALRALAEIEFDRATGKLSPADYESLKARYTRDALDAIRAPAATATPVAAPTPRPAPEPAAFCSACGTRLETESLFCGRCGTRVAA